MSDTIGKFVKSEAEACIELSKELLEAMPKKRQIEYLGHMNQLWLFLEAAKRAAPEK